jgi:hypothetical protein
MVMDEPRAALSVLDEYEAQMSETTDEAREMVLAAIEMRGLEAIYQAEHLERCRRLRREDKNSFSQVWARLKQLNMEADTFKQMLNKNGAAVKQEAARAPNGPKRKIEPSIAPDHPEPERPEINPAAYHGLAWDVVSAIDPETESDPVAILLQFLTSFGNAIGRGPYFLIEGTQHFTNLFMVLVGTSAKTRKGTSWGRVKQIMKVADLVWVTQRIKSGLSSGEGLIAAVRDAAGDDPGVIDKRLLALEQEFANVLIVCRREGNTISKNIRDAYDGLNLSSLTKTPQQATEPLISIVGHVNEDELRSELDRVSMANGFANRFLFACANRSKLLPDGGNLSDGVVLDLGQRIAAALKAAQQVTRMRRTAEAGELWRAEYRGLTEGRPGLLGAITGRADPHTVRLSMLYALLDGQTNIGVKHLQAALALWRYCEASARYVFGDSLGDPVADDLLRALRRVGAAGMTRTDISNYFARNRDRAQIGRALKSLLERGLARMTTRQSNGVRPTEVWHAI